MATPRSSDLKTGGSTTTWVARPLERTNEIYTHVADRDLARIRSPADTLFGPTAGKDSGPDERESR